MARDPYVLMGCASGGLRIAMLADAAGAATSQPRAVRKLVVAPYRGGAVQGDTWAGVGTGAGQLLRGSRQNSQAKALRTRPLAFSRSWCRALHNTTRHSIHTSVPVARPMFVSLSVQCGARSWAARARCGSWRCSRWGRCTGRWCCSRPAWWRCGTCGEWRAAADTCTAATHIGEARGIGPRARTRARAHLGSFGSIWVHLGWILGTRASHDRVLPGRSREFTRCA